MITVVSAIIRDPKGRFLLQRRASHKEYGGMLETPGGKVEPGEHEANALARELEEELTLKVVSIGSEPLLTVLYRNPLVNWPYVLVFYTAEIDVNSSWPIVSFEDATDVGFYTVDQAYAGNPAPSLCAILPLLHRLPR